MSSNFHEEIELLQQDIAQILTRMSFMIDGFDVDLACELEPHPNTEIESLYKSLEIAQEACFRFRELKAIDLPAIVKENLDKTVHFQ